MSENMSIRRFNLDLHKLQSQISVSVFQFDTAIRLDIGITDGGTPYKIPDGALVVLSGKREDDESNILHPCTVEGNRIIYDFEPTTTEVLGVTRCQFKLYLAGQEKLTSSEFIIVVGEKTDNGYDVEEAYERYSALDVLLGKAQEVLWDENIRAEAEKVRDGNELLRKEKELSRIEFETQRQTEEAKRDKAETERAKAEAARAKAEAARQAQIDGKVDKITKPRKLYGTVLDSDGKLIQTSYDVSYETASLSIPQRTYGGGLKVQKTPSGNDHATSKIYVDNTINKQIAPIEERVADLESLTLTYTKDSATAYEKVAPAECGKYVQIKSIGGASIKSKNLLNPADIIIDGAGDVSIDSINADGTITYTVYGSAIGSVDLTKLGSVGRYYVYLDGAGYWNENDINKTYLDFDASSKYIEEDRDYITETRTLKLMIWKDTSVTTNEYELVRAPEGTVFEPYFAGFRHAKVERIESRANDIGYPDNTAPARTTPRKFLPNTVIAGLNVGNYYVKNYVEIIDRGFSYITFKANHISYGVGYYFELKPNTNYNLSYESSGITLAPVFLNYDNDGNFINNDYTQPFTTNKFGKVVVLFYAKAVGEAKLSKIMLVEGDTQIPYKPFSAEPLDSLVIPESVRNLDGYGREGSTLDIVDGTVTLTVTRDDELVPLAEPTVTDVTQDIINANPDFPTKKGKLLIEGGGITRFVNEHEMPVPNTVWYVTRKE